ncbi:MAG: o-succinylbenzoate synthase [Deltaproteobacteria bacterium HGW-Deltaproteobacteria-14]|nr:MAG: o-succinylbenzoate synthase [Deltaproteobacteria bacterium HGW-Deltaproteobacteria-14]
MIVASAQLAGWRRPLPRPVRTAAGVITERRGLWLTLTAADGARAVGEAAPLPGFSDDSLAEARAALEGLCGPVSPLAGRDLEGPEAIPALLDALAWRSSAAHALDQALLGLFAQDLATPLWRLLGAPPDPGPLRCHRLVADPRAARAAATAGARTLKIKVGADPIEVDLARVAAIRDAVGPEIALRLDANGAWSEDAARAFLRRSEHLVIELIEDPVTVTDLPAMRRLMSEFPAVLIAADAGCRSAADLGAIARAGAADAVVLKPMLLGGPSRAAALAQEAARLGLRVMVTSTFDSEVALAAARAVALACPEAARLDAGLDPIAAGCPAPEAAWALPEPVRSAARARPDHPAVVFSGEDISWATLDARAARFAGALAARGVVSGDVVAISELASPDGVAALWATARLGAALFPLGERAAPAERAAALEAVAPRLVTSASELAATAPGPPPPERDLPLDEVRLVLLTGGTGGAPRVVSLTTGQLAFGALGSALRLGHDLGDRWLLALPLDHVGGLAVLFRTALAATTVVLHPRFDPGAVARALDDGDATLVSLVPEMLSRVLDARPGRPFPSTLRAILVGGAATPERLVARCRALGAPVALTWGMTEAASQIATRFPGDLAAGAGAPPLATARVEAAAEGRLTVHGPLVAGGRLATSDRGLVDELGRVRVHGRVDDVFVSGGENVDPAEVEAALEAHPAVALALVAGVPDPRWGARPVAALVARDGAARPTDDAVRAWLGERLSDFKRPDRFLWLDDLPRTALGKPSRAALREILAPEG